MDNTPSRDRNDETGPFLTEITTTVTSPSLRHMLHSRAVEPQKPTAQHTARLKVEHVTHTSRTR